MKKTVRIFTAFVCFAVLLVCGVAGYYIYRLPDRYYVEKGGKFQISSYFKVSAESRRGEFVPSAQTAAVPLEEQYTLKLFGIIPLKDVTVKAVDAPLVIPGGNPFGIKLLTDGVMVIGIGEVDTESGAVCPAANAGIRTGDILVSVGGKKVFTNQEIAEVISKSKGKPLRVVYKRNGQTENAHLVPAYSPRDCQFKAGMWVRDSTAGIGTVTFYDPETGAFGGLGHPVCDADTGQILPLSSGEAVSVAITGVQKGEAGVPGELIGNFTSLTAEGILTANNGCGIFGVLKNAPNCYTPIPMAMRQEVHCGDAVILTTVSGASPKEYAIRIEKLSMKEEGTRNMVVRITDPELLSLTGGIVQGMSGSPIIQDGKLVGAVTHVFVNDPTRGYGIFCDTMYEQALSACPQKAAA